MNPIAIRQDWDDRGLITFEEFCELGRCSATVASHVSGGSDPKHVMCPIEDDPRASCREVVVEPSDLDGQWFRGNGRRKPGQVGTGSKALPSTLR